jgi:anti-sigma factor RsiW
VSGFDESVEDTMGSPDRFTDRLSEYLDGEDLSTSDRADIEAHLLTCPGCRATLAELREVAAVAAALQDAAPARDLWNGVAARLESASTVVPFTPRTTRRFSFTLPQLVAAGLALMVLSGGLVWVARLDDPRTSLPFAVAQEDHEEAPYTPAMLTDSHYDQAVADLEKELEASRSRLDPETVRVLENNLRTIDLAIEQSRKALRADPSNVYLNGHFAQSRNRKLALLRRASALAMNQDTSGGS